jgi:MFS transporter, ACS family, glucarate transporter
MSRTIPYRYRVLVFLFFMVLITYLDRICISLVGVRIKSEFHLSNEQFGWILGAFALAYALFEIPAGMLGDRIGQRAVFIRIVLWWSVFTALTGLTTGFASLLVVRFLFGVGEAGAFPNGSAAIAHWFPAAENARGISSLSIGANAGAAIAPLLVIPIAAHFGWRASFFVNGLIGLLWVIICISWFRNNPAEVKNISAQERIYIEKNRRFLNHKQGFSWKAAFKSNSLWALSIAYYCCQCAQYFFIAWMAIYLQEGRHFSENGMKVITSYLFVVGMLGALAAGFFCDWLMKRKGLRFARRFMGLLTLGMMCVLIFIAGIATNIIVVVSSLMLANFFQPPNAVNAFSTCIDIGGNHAGTVVGIMNFFGQMGAFSLAVVFGKMFTATHDYNTPLYLLSAILGIGCLCWLMIDPEKRLKLQNATA